MSAQCGALRKQRAKTENSAPVCWITVRRGGTGPGIQDSAGMGVPGLDGANTRDLSSGNGTKNVRRDTGVIAGSDVTAGLRRVGAHGSGRVDMPWKSPRAGVDTRA